MNNDVLSYADLAKREIAERNELEETKKLLEESRRVLEEMAEWWKDSSQANAALANRLHTAERLLEEEQKQKEMWKEAYESLTNSRSWKMITKTKRLFGRK